MRRTKNNVKALLTVLMCRKSHRTYFCFTAAALCNDKTDLGTVKSAF